MYTIPFLKNFKNMVSGLESKHMPISDFKPNTKEPGFVFLGFYMDDETLEQERKRESRPQDAANTLQGDLISALRGSQLTKIDVVSVIPASDFPGNRSVVFPSRKSLGPDPVVYIGFINLPREISLPNFLSNLSFLFQQAKPI